MKKYQENLLDSKKRRTFAAQKSKDRDLAQLVAHTSGGREVAGSSPVIPTKKKTQITVNQRFGFLLFPNHHPTLYGPCGLYGRSRLAVF